jgi:Ras-related protein Rab-8A
MCTDVALTSNVTYKLQIWDTAGQERFRLFTKGYCKSESLVLLCFSIVDLESFQKLEALWLPHFKEHITIDTEMILVGLKSDLQVARAVPIDMAKDLAYKLQIPYFEASGKEYINIAPIFLYCIAEIISLVNVHCKHLRTIVKQELARNKCKMQD